MAEKFDNPNYNPEAGMKYLATHFEMFKPEVAKAMIADAKRKGVKIPPVVEAKARKAGIINSVRNAKFKVGDKVKFKNLFKPERGEETGVVTGYDTDGSVLIRDDDGIKVKASEKLVRLANSVRNAKFKVGDTVEAIRDRVHKLGVKGTVLKVDADAMVVKWADDGFTARYGIEGNFKNLTKEPKATPEDKMKTELSRSGAGSNPRTAHTWLTRHRRGLVSKYGREVYEKVMREATRGLLNAQIRSTNAIVAKAMKMDGNSVRNARLKVGDRVKVTWNPDDQRRGIVGKTGELLRLSSEGTALVDIDGHEYFTFRPYLELANSVLSINSSAGDRGRKALSEGWGHGVSTNAVVAKALAMNGAEEKWVDPNAKMLKEKFVADPIRTPLTINAVRVARNGNVVLRTVSGGTARVYEGGKVLYGGREYVAKAIGSPHMDKATLVDGAGNKIVVSLKDVDLKALNAVRNAWADAPDAATAKRDIEQTVRKAAEIAKRRSGAKATYKMTPNDNYWCGYIELTFNTEEEAKKYNPYYLFNELGDNKSILPKWSWAISSFNYQKNGKVVKIFVGRLAT